MKSSVTRLPACRPPAVPLVTHDPYFSVWSFADRLTDDWPRHWTGAYNGISGIARIDGAALRFAGKSGAAPDAMEQLDVSVLPTRTIYRFAARGVELVLTFLTPALPHDLDVLARPLTYLLLDARSTDGKPHHLAVCIDTSAEWTVDSPNQQVVWARYHLPGLHVMRTGSAAQPMLGRAGDNLRIEWGYMYMAAPAEHATTCLCHAEAARERFARHGDLPQADDLAMPCPATSGWPTMATAMDFGKLSAKPVRRWLMLAYDDLFSVEYFHRKLRPYWRRAGAEIDELLHQAAAELPQLERRCRKFDDELVADLITVGGPKYAGLCCLAYRQSLAAHKLAADADGTPLYFSKENFSNGCIATVDVTYPSAPMQLLLNPALLRGQVLPILQYASGPRWRFDFAPHDLGTYPLANGQVYGGGEKTDRDQMPVEECGNMLILMAALAHADDGVSLARQYWPLLSRWAQYLRDKGLNPATQLCTDDFAGHLGHNTNLSLKAVVALGAYARLAQRIGQSATARTFGRLAKDMARRWVRMADDGDHFRLTFDRPGTWSQKYNLVWDEILGLKLFGPEVARREVEFYKKANTPNGLPLDSRKTYTKLDWVAWSACLARDDADFRELCDPLFDWANRTPTRVPLADWYETTDGRQIHFQARSVVGGVFIRMLRSPAIWRKWLARARNRSV
jgi:hypothetical protein